MTLHEGELAVDESVVRALLADQCPEWAGLSLARAGAGTENTMYRLGDELLVRLPRTPDRAAPLRKERQWLPRMAPLLPCAIPAPVHAGAPAPVYPSEWAVYRWIDGVEASPESVQDWAAFGADLAGFVRALHGIDLMGARRAGELSWYRGGGLRDCDDWVNSAFTDCRRLAGAELDVDTLESYWRDGLALPGSPAAQVWMHADLKPTNLLVGADGRLRAVIDWGSLTVGLPDAEHSTVWDLPAGARHAYREGLELDDATWTRARAWAVAVAASGVAYYWDTFPAFVVECRARLANILSA
ncbi:phosphotransferase [Actinoplanes lobatus]|uniref:Phosphotransferase n=1 Tax=Actinoplanes lobatus TaxID=113568 RepID=A0A7W7HM00_9ACTN|nr:aminoglycoside phosphotransferase family protein [Actinoplanes lobatus]MBB4752990.1 aminoglycoside phosphotransferase (APT) family kinase protein [Actinoplanes lobatus]GGN87544.1 phosphotransferase [Actinoplanes lobatus]GIE39597.1 phosphotransferase [Actinoplanes lobatus]